LKNGDTLKCGSAKYAGRRKSGSETSEGAQEFKRKLIRALYGVDIRIT
jgi:hypothetical protein